jgi:peptidoglycan/xylan/chitin deacetylase (PgdA/CDA1 family)
MKAPDSLGPQRDFVGYGRRPPRMAWPNGCLVAVNLVVCYEEGAEYSIFEGDARNDGWGEYALTAPPGIRDLGTETHFEYGSRVGIWRIARLLERHGVSATISACAEALARNSEVTSWIRESGHDLLGHGLRWSEQWTMSRDEERNHLHRAVARFTELLGERPIGWNSRSYPSVNTRELLVEEGGFLYDSDPCNDDLPYFVPIAEGRLLIVPYSKTLNDSRYLVSPGYVTPNDFVTNVRAYLDFLVEEAKQEGGRMATIAVHARWSGQPNRAVALQGILQAVQSRPQEIMFMRRNDIAKYWLSLFAYQGATA